MNIQTRSAPPPPEARRARGAVSTLFFVNGFTYTNAVPWLPVIKSQLELSNAELGLAIAAMPTGAILTGMLAGPMIHWFGSGRTAVGTSLVSLGALPFIALAQSWWMLAAALFVLGSADAWTDSAQNSHGLRVQRRYKRTIINTFHAVWSLAAVTGGLLGAAMAGAGVPILWHLGGVAVLLVGVNLVVSRMLLPGPDSSEREDGTDGESGRRLRVPGRAVLLLLVLGVLLMFAGGIEDSAASWGAVYMTSELEAPLFLAAMPFVACQAMMTLGRLVGDRVTDRFGAVAVGRACGLLAGGGIAFALLLPHPVTTVIGFGVMGLGVSTLFPLTLSAAGNVPGVRTGDGITVVGWLGRAGFLAFPPMVGFLADSFSLGGALWVIAGAGVGAFLLAFALRPRV
ncbi:MULTISPECIES: MFS transporter [Nocardiopsis]|uniref:Fucose permease n=1 Tax=Nocardiopsis sinuspersici TaxID=501010 RepID=A0A1V3C8Q6_9ACTN|nr:MULTISPECIES: MFS transporter [Nocardiopsis]NYH50527.1 fucose permease [Nocardiopsis sinuspersici]OOC57165.1 MFS transporter [Nocardiopsis sinuspersici]